MYVIFRHFGAVWRVPLGHIYFATHELKGAKSNCLLHLVTGLYVLLATSQLTHLRVHRGYIFHKCAKVLMYDEGTLSTLPN